MNNKVMSEATRQRYETMWGQKEELRFLANLGTFRAESPSRVEEVPPHVRRDLLRGYIYAIDNNRRRWFHGAEPVVLRATAERMILETYKNEAVDRKSEQH